MSASDIVCGKAFGSCQGQLSPNVKGSDAKAQIHVEMVGNEVHLC